PRDGTRSVTFAAAYYGDRPDGRVLEKGIARAALVHAVSVRFLQAHRVAEKCGGKGVQFPLRREWPRRG
ncbi:MAG TPA: hypothetical protein VNK91_14555, partial [Burkholderiaceae bacterium]|nr:hypothetical protein [Burkholderiaceae bacterium]